MSRCVFGIESIIKGKLIIDICRVSWLENDENLIILCQFLPVTLTTSVSGDINMPSVVTSLANHNVSNIKINCIVYQAHGLSLFAHGLTQVTIEKFFRIHSLESLFRSESSSAILQN